MVLGFLLWIFLLISQIKATEDLRKKAYEMVYPQKLPVLHKRDTEKNQKHGPQEKYDSEVLYEMILHGTQMVLHLKKTEDLVAPNYSETHYSQIGEEITTKPQFKDHCYYQGHVLHEKDSAVSLSICDGLRGYIRKHDQRYLIEPLEHSDQGEHAIFKYEHKIQDTSNGSCVVYNFSKREAITQGSRSGLSLEMQLYLKEKKYIELFIVADHALYRRHNHLQKWLRTRIFGMVNFVNMLYKTLNIQVILVGLEMWTNGDKIEVNSNLGTTLLYFGGWQETTLKKRKNFDHAQLLSGNWLSQTAQGTAYPWGMCVPYHSSSIVKDHLHDTNMVADKMAHELAHSLGMQHDTYPCACTYGRCVMDGGGSIPSQGFSKCNRNQYRQYLLDYKPMCILNVPLSKDIITFPKCGNQILEVGEECDCGSLEDCTNVCCEANKCILKPGSACGGGECCEACKIKKAGILCRTAKDECDLPELCDGFSPKCPVDRFRVNGFPCQNSEGYCFMGKCPTRDSQCSEMFKDEAKGSHDICYERNKGGHKFGYCKKVDKRFIPCEDKDLKCGKIYCTGGQYFPSYGEDKTYHLKVPEQNITVECKAFFPFQYTEDLGMVASGTKCGEGKVCKNGECVNIETVYESTNCSSHCPGNAVCDHELQCQCEEGLTHPNCDDTTFTTNVSIVAGVLTMVLATVVISVLFVHRQKASKQKQVHSPSSNTPAVDNQGHSNEEQQHSRTEPIVCTQNQNASDTFEDIPAGYSSPQYITMKSTGKESRVAPVSNQNVRMPPAKPRIPPPPIPTMAPPFSPQGLKPEVQNSCTRLS